MAGAPLLCSFYVRSRGERYYAIVARVSNLVRRLRRIERVDVGDALAANYVHCFTRDEIRSKFSAGGFLLAAFVAAPYGHAVGVTVHSEALV